MDFADEIGGIVESTECKSCPWYKHCVDLIPNPLIDVAPMFKGMLPGTAQEMAQAVQKLQEGMVICCPIFAKRLKESPRLAESIRKMMQEWNQPPTAKAGEFTG